MRKASHSGFTLVEVLVVVGIITIMISLLLPALTKARRAMYTVSCASNMRQIGITMSMYAQDNRGYLPYAMMDVGPPISSAGNPAANNYSWDDLLLRYLLQNPKESDLYNQGYPYPVQVFECREDSWDRELLLKTYHRRSYSMVESCAAYGQPAYGMATRTFQYTTGWAPNAAFRCFKYTDAPAASETLLLVEKPMVNNQLNVNILGHAGGCLVDKPSDQMQGLVAPIHSGKFNYLCVDGHVSLMEPDETIKAPATVSSSMLTAAPATLNYMWTRDPND